MDSEVVPKMNQIAQCLDEMYSKEKKKDKSPGYAVGVFTTLQLSEVSWIDRELRRASEKVKETRYVDVTKFGKKKEFEKAVSEFPFYIYISTEQKWKNVTSTERKNTLSMFKKKNLILLIADMEDSSDEEKQRLSKGMKDYVSNIFLFKRFEGKPDHPQDPGTDRGSDTFHAGVNLDQNQPFRLPQPTLVLDGAGLQAEMSQRPADRKHVVAIFSRSVEEDFSWLVRLLREAFQDFVGDVRCCYISNNGYQELSDDISKCTFAILYHTKHRGRVNITDLTDSLYDEELERISAELGRRNVIVLIDDLEDSSDQLRTEILQTQPTINKLACDLILISGSEKANKPMLTTKMKDLKFVFGGEHSAKNMQNSRKSDQRVPPNPQLPLQYPTNGAGNVSPALSRERIPNAVARPSKPKVAIFSKSEESDYSWLSQQLSSEGLDIRSYKVSSLNQDQPQEMAFQCRLVILYHNMNTGKLRLTDSKDALYHNQLEMLSTKFGKRRVIVVIDDLTKSEPKIKSEIFERQPSTAKYVADIFLFSSEEKKSLKKKEPTKDGKKMMDKISAIKEMLSK